MKRLASLACLLGLAIVSSSCASSKTDWNSRLGSYTFDQAVVELGPPDKEAMLSDGSKVAEWLTRRGERGAFVSSYAPYPARPYRGYYGAGWGTYYDPGSPDYWIRLTFDPEKRLQQWKKLSR
jgi:hypothetical protein